MPHSGTTVTNPLNVLWLFLWVSKGRQNRRTLKAHLFSLNHLRSREQPCPQLCRVVCIHEVLWHLQMLRGLIKDITGYSTDIHMRTDANNLVTTASTTHVPEQQETIHMIQMLRKEACSGAIADLSHIRTQWCLADCLTKKSASPQALIDAVRSGCLKEVDAHPPFRSLIEHKAYMRGWLPTVCTHVDFSHDVFYLGDSLH